jgi:RNA polymerase sporulation-specific sigma factor
MNDYELLYLIGERNDDALTCMIEKYQPLILKKLFQFKIRPSERDDFVQEGNLMLLHAIKIFNPAYQKTFTRFFELILTRRFINLMTPSHKQMIYFTEELFDHIRVEETTRWRCQPAHHALAKATLNTLEYAVFVMYYQEGLELAFIATQHHVSIKKVYNTLYQIKSKLKLVPEFLDIL